MRSSLAGIICVSLMFATAAAAAPWQNSNLRFRTTVARTTPYRDAATRPVEVAVDFPLLLERAGIAGEFDAASVRVFDRTTGHSVAETSFAFRTEFNTREEKAESCLAWLAHSQAGRIGVCDIYFDTKDRKVRHRASSAGELPAENLVANPGFEEAANGLPVGWTITPEAFASLGVFEHTAEKQSLKIGANMKTSDCGVEVNLSQRIDVRRFAGQQLLFQCDLMAEGAPWGVPVCIELRQFRADGSRILEYAVQPRWLRIDLAQGQLVQFRERGRFSPETAELELAVRCRCRGVNPEAAAAASMAVWMDRVVIRPGERWPWPAAHTGDFVEGALERAPLNRAFAFSGLRRIIFTGASDGTLTANVLDPGPKSVHWGLERGTLEFWCKPAWEPGDVARHVFFEGVASSHRTQSMLSYLDGKRLAFSIADADGGMRKVQGAASLKPDQWAHIAATWDFPGAHLQLFVDGARVAELGPGDKPWPSSLTAANDNKTKGIALGSANAAGGGRDPDGRSMPMQAFIGGDRSCRRYSSAESALDEFRVSDTVRYSERFSPARQEFDVDAHTRALFHFEHEMDGVHDSGDRFVRAFPCSELPRREETAALEILSAGKIERRVAVVKPYASPEQFEKNRPENRFTVTRPVRALPDPRFIEQRDRTVERIAAKENERFFLEVGGDYEPVMRFVTFEHAGPASETASPLPSFRINDAVVPYSRKTLLATLATNAESDAERAYKLFKYTADTTNYYNDASGRYVTARAVNQAVAIQPFDQCGPLNTRLYRLLVMGGISAAEMLGTHHMFQQAFYQGSWRLLDMSSRKYWLCRDNATVAGRRTFEQDVYLMVRQDPAGRIRPWIPGFPLKAGLGSSAQELPPMEPRLQPGEKASLCWHNEGRWFAAIKGKHEPMHPPYIPPLFGNGAVIYEPDTQGGAAAMENLLAERTQDGATLLRAEDPDKPASLTYRAETAFMYTHVDISGAYSAANPAALTASLSLDEGKTWTGIWKNPKAEGSIDASLAAAVTGRTAYWLKIGLAPDPKALLKGLRVRSVILEAPLALPGRLKRGENRVELFGAPAAPIRVTCKWTERYRSDLGLSINGIGFYTMEDDFRRNLFVVAPGGEFEIETGLQGETFRGELAVEGIPAGWDCDRPLKAVTLGDAKDRVEIAFRVRAAGARTGELHALSVVLRQGETIRRRLPVQVLIAENALAREAEAADALPADATAVEDTAVSGGKAVAFRGKSGIEFHLDTPKAETYALWVRARWSPKSRKALYAWMDGETPRRRLAAFKPVAPSTWASANVAHTKTFSHFGEQFVHWTWYRVPGFKLKSGSHRLYVGTEKDGFLDAIMLLPQNDKVDCSATRLLQNWNFAPWRNPW